MPLNPLQARLDLQLGSGLQANVLNNEKSEVKDPIQLSISSTSEESSTQTLNDPVQIAIISSTSPENSLKSPLRLEISSNSTSSEESSNQSLIYENGVTERTNKGRTGPRLPLPLPPRRSSIEITTMQATRSHDPDQKEVCVPEVRTEEYDEVYENLSKDITEEHTAKPGPDNPVPVSGKSEVGVKSVPLENSDTRAAGKPSEEPLSKSNLRPDKKKGQKCVAIAMGKIMHSPFPLMDKEEVEAVERYLLADIANISEIKISNLASEPEEDGLFLHQIQVKFNVDNAAFGTEPPTSLANHISQYEWLRRNQSIVRITDVHFKVIEEKSPLMKLCRKKK